MATYVFRCADCADFEVIQSMSAVEPTHPCPACGRASRRVFSPPALSRTAPGLDRAVQAAEASAETPQVVRSVPAGAPRPSSPRWNPFTGGNPIPVNRRAPGPHQPLPRL